MFRVVKIVDIIDGSLNEESMVVEDAFFFTIDITNYYRIYNKTADIIGIIPMDYNLFFKIDNSPVFEDIDMANIVRLHQQGVDFQLAATAENSNKVKLIQSSDIARFELIENDILKIPFTNQAFDSEGVVIFKNMNSLADSMEPLY